MIHFIPEIHLNIFSLKGFNPFFQAVQQKVACINFFFNKIPLALEDSRSAKQQTTRECQGVLDSFPGLRDGSEIGFPQFLLRSGWIFDLSMLDF